MKGKIAFEEHFAIADTLEQSKVFAGDGNIWDDFTRELMDLETERLEHMDKSGIELALLSLNAPGIQSILEPDKATGIARKANDTLANMVSKYPDRYAGMAALPMHDPDIASTELERCVKELGFKGILVNGFQQVNNPDNIKYYDQVEYRTFWATVQELDIPFYLHPRMTIPSQARAYEGHPWLMSSPWGFAVETSIHALRLCGSGLFEDYPNLKICLGHFGEGIPFGLWRIDARMKFSPRGYRGEKLLGEYFRDNFYLTTSGNFNDAAFRCTLDTFNNDKICYSADYPFERMEDASDWFDNTSVVNNQLRQKIGRDNAINLFKLGLE